MSVNISEIETPVSISYYGLMMLRPYSRLLFRDLKEKILVSIKDTSGLTMLNLAQNSTRSIMLSGKLLIKDDNGFSCYRSAL
jgi:hypothetical protein